MKSARAAALVAVATLAASCGGDKPAGTSPPPGAKRVDAATAGSLSGRVVLEGSAPVNRPIPISADPFCTRQNPNGAVFEPNVVVNGGLENVFVYVKDGLGNYYFDVPTDPVKLDQQACHYRPHVTGVRVGQPLAIGNSDDTVHNVHALAHVNAAFNKGQALKGVVDRKVFNAQEVMVPFKCDVHPWMQAYVGVVAHPYFAVTHDGGTFKLEGLPAGTYTIEAWHEKLGTQTQSVTIGEKETKAITFTFTAPAAAN